jgi:hypothetical protein
MEHSIVQGSGWQMTPWGAVQQAAFPSRKFCRAALAELTTAGMSPPR